MAKLATSHVTSTATSQETEADVRRDLAACYRLIAHYGWDDLIATHISARLPGKQETFLINPFGMMFDEVTASSLVKINADGEILEDTPYTVNQAGYVIHSAIHQVRPDAGCVIHLHTKDGVAVSMVDEGLLALNQTAMLIGYDIAFHEYEGPAFNLEERERLQADLSEKNLMILRNHGTLALGQSVAEAFHRIYFLEWSCATQVRAFSMGRSIHHPPADVENTMKQRPTAQAIANYSALSWPALLRKLDRIDPGFRD